MTGDVGNYILFRDSFYRLISGRGRPTITHHPPARFAGFLYSPHVRAAVRSLRDLATLPRLAAVERRKRPGRLLRITRFCCRRERLDSRSPSCSSTWCARSRTPRSNALVAGLMLLAFVALEQGRERGPRPPSSLAPSSRFFPVAAGALAIFGAPPPGRRVRFLLWCVGIGLALAALPLLVLPPASVAAVYKGWYGIIQRDTGLRGQSVMRILSDWFGSTRAELDDSACRGPWCYSPR